MSGDDRPQLDLSTETHIEAALNQADQNLWANLQMLMVAAPASSRLVRRVYPSPYPSSPPAKQPMMLRSFIESHARTLYIAEGHQYPEDQRLAQWLQNLTGRIVDRTMGVISAAEEAGKEHGVSLEYHGLTPNQMRKTARDAVTTLITQRMAGAPPPPPLPPEVQEQMDAAPQDEDDPSTWSPLHHRIAALNALNAVYQAPRETIHESFVRTVLAEQYGIKPEEVTWKQIQFEVSGLLRYYPAIELIPTTPLAPPTEENPVADDTELQRRAKLLEDYKAAAGNPSSKKIYEARNSGVHKPEFYRWLRGQLPSGSSTAQAFERFLRDKRPPIPRKPKP